jgi:hypothetical protein
VIRRVLSFSGAAALAACAPPQPGFFQFAEIAAAPERACVQQVAESVADPDSVSLQEQSGDWIVEYVRGGTRYGMQVSPKSSPPFFAHYGWTERDTPAETLRLMRDQMREVTRLVEERCDVKDLASRVKERCAADRCAEIAK